MNRKMFILITVVMLHAHTVFAYLAFTDIGTYNDKSVSGIAINNNGEVTGNLVDSQGTTTAFYWGGSGIIELSSAVGQGLDINDNSVVAGKYAPSGTNVAFTWTVSGGFVNYQPGINDTGKVILANGDIYGRYGGTTATHWTSPTTHIDYVTPGGFGNAEILDVNPISGHAIGQAYNWSGQIVNRQATYWSSPSSSTLLINPIAGDNSYAAYINTADQIIGNASDESNNVYPLFWNSPNETPEVVDTSGRAFYLSNDGTSIFGTQYGVATLWLKKDTAWISYDLNDYIDPTAGYVLLNARAMNSNSQLLCQAQYDGENRTVIVDFNMSDLYPVPEPLSIILFIMAFAGWRFSRNKNC